MRVPADLAALLVLAVGISGLLAGSFLNVVVHRVPRGESVVHPPSACPECGSFIAWYDNIPVLSWLVLRARCRPCGARISARYPIVEAGTGAAFASVAAAAVYGGLAAWAVPAFLYAAAISVALALIDVDVHRLPDAIVLPSYPVMLALLAVASGGTGDWWALVRAVVGGAAGFAFYFLLAFVYPAGMGFGDVKLAGILGMLLGWLGWAELVVGGFLGFLLGGVAGLVLILTRLATRRSMIPFGPYMLLGTWLAVALADPVARWYLGIAGVA